MNRRQALQVMAATPIVLSASVSRAADDGVTFYRCGEHKQMARQLWANMEVESATWPMTFEIPLMREVCDCFCEKLLDPRDLNADVYYPDQDPDLIRKNVSFGVMTGPEAIINGRPHKAMSRRTRVRGHLSEDDLKGSCRGIPHRVEVVEVVTDESVLEIMREIRNDWKGGAKTNVYALSLPPFLSPLFLPAGDITHCRRWMIRYAKAAP